MNFAALPLQSLMQRLMRSRAIRAVGVMASATGAGQLLIFATLPVVTRLYDPVAFGLYALIAAFVGVASVGACLCLDLAIIQCDTPQSADELCAAAVLSTPVTALISAVALAVLIDAGLFGYGALAWWTVPLVATMIGLNGLYLASRYRHLREQRYLLVARATLAQGAGRAFAPLVWFFLLSSWAGLMLGELTGRALGVKGMLLPLLRQLKENAAWVGIRQWWSIVKRERRYTVVLLATVLVDACASLLIAPLLAGAYGPGVAGEYFLVASVLVAPSALIGTAAADVLHTRGAALLRSNPERLPYFLQRAVGLLLLAGCGIYLPVYFLAPYVLPVLFGPKWVLNVPIAQAMTPFMIVAFAASPCSRLLVVLNRTGLKVLSDVIRFVGTPLVIVAATMLHLPFTSAIWLLTWFLAAAYAIYLALTFLAVYQAPEVINAH